MHLFVRNISNTISKETIKNVFENHGFGTIKEVIYPLGKRNNLFQNAIVVYHAWDLENTQCTRSILESGRHLSIYAENEQHPWKVFRYNTEKQVPVMVFPDILLPNVTDNRIQRRDVRYDYVLEVPDSPPQENNILHAPKKQKNRSLISNDILASIRTKLLFDE